MAIPTSTYLFLRFEFHPDPVPRVKTLRWTASAHARHVSQAVTKAGTNAGIVMIGMNDGHVGMAAKTLGRLSPALESWLSSPQAHQQVKMAGLVSRIVFSDIMTSVRVTTIPYGLDRGEHIHHGYWPSDKSDITKEAGQVELIELLISQSQLKDGSRVLDTGCGIGGTSRYLARKHHCNVTGVTISPEQVKIAKEMSGDLLADDALEADVAGSGHVMFLELDAENMADHFSNSSDPGYDVVWISEALSHIPNKKLFFENAMASLKRKGHQGGKLVVADWFKAEGLTDQEFKNDVSPIEHGMLLPPLCTQNGYVDFAKGAGFKVFAEPLDISQQVSKTWDISIGLVASPALWALAFTQGPDFVSFLRAFVAMRNGHKIGSFRHAVMVFEQS